MTKKRNSCGNGKWCEAMLTRLGESGRRGFNTVRTINMELGTTRLIGVRYCLDRYDRGLMLNYCPWCGAMIDGFREPDKPKPPFRIFVANQRSSKLGAKNKKKT